MQTISGLDKETLELVLKSLHDYARDSLPDQRHLDLIEKLCGSEIGIQLLFVPEEYDGMGGDAVAFRRSSLGRIDSMARIWL